MTVKAVCVSKNADQSGSVVRFAVDPQTVQTDKGPEVQAAIVLAVAYRDATAADEFKHGSSYNISVEPVPL